MFVNGWWYRCQVRKLPVVERERGVCCTVKLELAPAKSEQLAAVLKALADPTRLQMVLALRAATQPICVCDFTAAFGLSQPTVSFHMGKLRAAGLVEATKQGIWSYYRLRPHLSDGVRTIIDALA
jgi:ArsR family transcriptional regulator